MKIIKTRIAGFNHHPGAPDRLLRMRTGTKLRLVKEPTNPHDPNAIRITTTAGNMLGFIPAVDCKLVLLVLEKLNDPDVHVETVKTGDFFNSIALHVTMGDPLA